MAGAQSSNANSAVEGNAVASALAERFGDAYLIEDERGHIVRFDAGTSDALPVDGEVVGTDARRAFEAAAERLIESELFLRDREHARRAGVPDDGRHYQRTDATWLVRDYRPIDVGSQRHHMWRFRCVSLELALGSGRYNADLVRASEEWRQTLDAIPALVVRLDSSCAIARINAAARAVAGRPYRELVGAPIASLGSNGPWRMIQEIAQEALVAGDAHRGAVTAAHDARTWDITAKRVEGGVIVSARDITVETQLQESLRQSERMSSMGSLVAGVAHEVRNPLFSISATLDAFDARFGDRGEYHRHLTALRSEVSRLSDLMQGLLEYGRPVARSVEPAAIDTAVGTAVNECRALARSHGIEIVTRVDRQAPAICMDVRHITQVIRNLIENAIQHSPEGSDVEVVTSRTELGATPGASIAVHDRGPGIKQSDAERIFEPFFTRRRGGTGLGLAIVQRAVLAHGGRVTMQPREGGGTSIIVQLPLDAPQG